MLTQSRFDSRTGYDAPRPVASVVGAEWPRRILLATDGSPPSDAAIAATRVLAARRGASVRMLSVHAPRIAVPSPSRRYGFEQCEAPERFDAARLLRAVRAQRHLHHTQRDWSLHLEVGDPTAVIVRVAKETAADLVVLGIGRHEPADRFLGGRTALGVARYLTVPLFAAARDCGAPERCVVALPEGRADEGTLRAAAACLPPGARLWVVLPDRFSAEGAARNDEDALREIVERSGRGRRLGEVNLIEVERADGAGDVLRIADDVGAQLIAVPVRGDPGPVRTFLRNLSDPLLLAARCSVLVVPD